MKLRGEVLVCTCCWVDPACWALVVQTAALSPLLLNLVNAAVAVAAAAFAAVPS